MADQNNQKLSPRMALSGKQLVGFDMTTDEQVGAKSALATSGKDEQINGASIDKADSAKSGKAPSDKVSLAKSGKAASGKAPDMRG